MLTAPHIVYFIGAGGIGMSALARYFNAQGAFVAGYDKTPSPLTEALSAEGISLHFEDRIDSIPGRVRNATADELLVVYTPAVPAGHKGLNWFKEKGFVVKKRAEVLAAICNDYKTIAVAGTHGKTTTVAMIAHIFHACKVPSYAFIGGLAAGYQTNFLHSMPDQKPEYVIVEADEYDRSFLSLNPDIAVITSVDSDHLDIYGSHASLKEAYAAFAGKVNENGKLILNEQISGLNAKLSPKVKTATYGYADSAEYRISNQKEVDGRSVFRISMAGKEESPELISGMPGKHNVENFTAAIAVALTAGINLEPVYQSISTFQGVYRRFEYLYRDNQCVYIDDYAHHPEELASAIDTAKRLFPGKLLTVVFQPHLYSRTRDQVDGFAKVLSDVDELILLDIYPAREEPIPGISSEMILEKVKLENKKLLSKDALLQHLKNTKIEVLMTLGAGDIDRLTGEIAGLLKSYKARTI